MRFRVNCFFAVCAASIVALAGFAAAQEEPEHVLPGLNAAEQESEEAMPPPTPEVRVARAKGALLRGLDKVSGRSTDLEVAVGDAIEYGRLEIRLGECRYPADDPSSDAFAQLTITDTAQKVTRFSGWMIASSPALSALDDARYDVWVISCQS